MANLITAGRILLVIPFVVAFMANAPWNMTAAFVIFVVAALTDFIDGAVARSRGEVSALGAALDPLADKLLIAAALVLLIRNGIIQNWGVIGALIILLREILVGGLREALSVKGEKLPVTRLAKVKTTAQMLGVGLMIAAAPGGIIGDEARSFAVGIFWLAVILTLWTGAAYTLQAVRLLRRAEP